MHTRASFTTKVTGFHTWRRRFVLAFLFTCMQSQLGAHAHDSLGVIALRGSGSTAAQKRDPGERFERRRWRDSKVTI